jgi:hypothetical protein
MSALPRLLAPFLLVAAALAIVPSVLSPGDLPCHRDLLDFVEPVEVQFSRAIAGGDLPWWDPWTLGGRPFLANLQAQVFYPPNWIHLGLDLPWALSIFLAGHLLLGGFGARRLALALGAGQAPALLAGAGYLGGGFLVSLTDLTNQLCTAAWLPWTWLAALSYGRDPGPRRLAAWSACVLASLLGAAPQHAALGGLSSLVFAALAEREGGARLGARRAVAAGTLAAALALLAGAGQFGPFAELVAQGDRGVVAPLAEEGKHALTAGALLSFVVAPEGTWDSPAGPFVRSLYLGPLVLLAAAAAALRRDRWSLGLALIAALSLLLAAGGALPGPGRWLEQATPFLRYPIKNAGLAALAIPLLAALGWQAVTAALADRDLAGPSLRALVAWLLPLIVLADLVHAHRPLVLAYPVHQVLARTELIDSLAANTRADGPRVHSTGLTGELLEQRARLVLAGDTLGMMRHRVEFLDGGLPAVFEVHSTWGGAAVTPGDRAELLERARGRAVLELADELRAGFVLAPAGSRLPLTRLPAPGGVAELYLLPEGRGFPTREWDGPNHASGAAGLDAPSDYPGWREGPDGVWTFRPRLWPLLALLSLLGLGALAALALRRPSVDPAEGPA